MKSQTAEVRAAVAVNGPWTPDLGEEVIKEKDGELRVVKQPGSICYLLENLMTTVKPKDKEIEQQKQIIEELNDDRSVAQEEQLLEEVSQAMMESPDFKRH